MKKITTALLIAVTTATFAQVETTVFEQPYRLKADGELVDVKEVGHSAALIYDYNRDGKNDLLVGYFGTERVEYDQLRGGHHLTKGGCNIYLNKGTNKNPEYTFTGKLQAGGKMAYVPTDCCVGLVPKVADLDGDGIDDMVSGSYPGQAYFWKGIGEGMFEPFVFLKDKTGRAINPDHTTTVTPFDWDADGDLDLVWGVRFKGTYVSINSGNKTNPQFEVIKHIEMLPFGEGREDLSSNSVPVDWDGDGLFDIVCGSEFGHVAFYKNTGKKGQPQFTSKPEVLINNVHNHNSIEGDDRPHGFRSKVFPYDYNGDGKMDLLVGDVYSGKIKGRELTPEEQVEKEELEEVAMAEWEKDLHKLEKFRAFTDKRHKEIMEANPDLTETEAMGMAWHDMPEDMMKEYELYNKRSKALWKPLEKFPTDKHTNHGFVWVYIRK
jgi:hypothetical protein